MRNNFRDDQSTGSIETSGFSDDDENEDQYDQEEESAPMAPIQGWDVFEVGYFKVSGVVEKGGRGGNCPLSFSRNLPNNFQEN